MPCFGFHQSRGKQFLNRILGGACGKGKQIWRSRRAVLFSTSLWYLNFTNIRKVHLLQRRAWKSLCKPYIATDMSQVWRRSTDLYGWTAGEGGKTKMTYEGQSRVKRCFWQGRGGVSVVQSCTAHCLCSAWDINHSLSPTSEKINPSPHDIIIRKSNSSSLARAKKTHSGNIAPFFKVCMPLKLAFDFIGMTLPSQRKLQLSLCSPSSKPYESLWPQGTATSHLSG